MMICRLRAADNGDIAYAMSPVLFAGDIYAISSISPIVYTLQEVFQFGRIMVP